MLLIVEPILAYISPENIGVITPYKKQVEKILKELKLFPGTEAIQVSSVDAFQGKEKDVIIFSAVRSNARYE
jgi:superfamily I DNA and/or RNA helicase